MTKTIHKMLKALPLLLTFNISLLTCFAAFSQSGAAINTTGNTADPSAILDISSNNSGLLIPRLTTTERDNIISPASGLIIYNLTVKCFEFYENKPQFFSFYIIRVRYVYSNVRVYCLYPLNSSSPN